MFLIDPWFIPRGTLSSYVALCEVTTRELRTMRLGTHLGNPFVLPPPTPHPFVPPRPKPCTPGQSYFPDLPPRQPQTLTLYRAYLQPGQPETLTLYPGNPTRRTKPSTRQLKTPLMVTPYLCPQSEGCDPRSLDRTPLQDASSAEVPSSPCSNLLQAWYLTPASTINAPLRQPHDHYAV